MALFILCGSTTSFSTRFYLLALIALVLLCFSSYCSSSPIVSSVTDSDQLPNDMDESSDDYGMNYDLPFRSSSHTSYPEQSRALSNERFIQLLLKSALNQPEYHYNKHNSKRYAIQAFHAMRG
ncbi:unnamed protein product [Adineta steineri]|uniref:Uncharacterized protein n=1 Tax=Adineta steineri TaxID=433720 RepID=A0A815CP27_9BILA|nr:unnamed protein product [Adineta steineri]CAF1310731.1 unnamed protein product [Adineta steineri]CAF3488169.1 unnamed protein product [Adineta steineri]CAF3817868.1 unnamed protein product [Adineta steineri]